ncbi:MAG TPA: hypothetical protein VM097_11850 [Mycobacteriales bacterium]|nr:hypothetical protein [Mycobacteriales bacterium]
MIEDLLRDTLASPDWDLPVRPGAMEDLRRRRTTHRRRTAGAAALGGLALVGAAVAGVTLLPERGVELATYASGGVPAGSPAPGITPSWVPEHGRDWLLTSEQTEQFWAAHTHPSPAPGQSTVESPAPLGPLSQELADEVATAGLPGDAQVRREDSVGGQPGATMLHLTLPGGTPVEVSRATAQGPWTYLSGREQFDQGITVVDVPGTASAAVIYPADAGFGMASTPRAVAVQVVTRGGVTTTWVAPESVGLETLKEWAFTAARHQGS